MDHRGVGALEPRRTRALEQRGPRLLLHPALAQPLGELSDDGLTVGQTDLGLALNHAPLLLDAVLAQLVQGVVEAREQLLHLRLGARREAEAILIDHAHGQDHLLPLLCRALLAQRGHETTCTLLLHLHLLAPQTAALRSPTLRVHAVLEQRVVSHQALRKRLEEPRLELPLVLALAEQQQVGEEVADGVEVVAVAHLDLAVELEAQLAVRCEKVEPLGAQRLQPLRHLGGRVREARVDRLRDLRDEIGRLGEAGVRGVRGRHLLEEVLKEERVLHEALDGLD